MEPRYERRELAERACGCVITEIGHYRSIFALISPFVSFHGPSYCLYTFFFFLMFIYLERERDGVYTNRGEAEKDNPKKAPHCPCRAWRRALSNEP